MVIGFRPPKGFGTRAQLDAAVGQLRDLPSQGGNGDRLIHNEHLAKDTVGGRYSAHPIVAKMRAWAGPGMSTKDEVALIEGYLANKEAEWGCPVTQLDLSGRADEKIFKLTKAVELERIGRTPADVTDGFVQAAGKVDGETIKPRKIFWQRFKPIGTPTGKVVVMGPGFKETGENFYEQIAKENAKGHDVIIMDHQWGGMSDGKAGGLDRLFGAARDFATVVTHASQVLGEDYPADKFPDAGLIISGNSMGGAAAFAAATMNDNGRLQLSSPDLKNDKGEYLQMPKALDGLLQSPFFGKAKGLLNSVVAGVGKLPFLNPITKWSAPDIGAPPLSSNARVKQLNNQTGIEQDVRAQIKTMAAAEGDLKTVLDLVAAGEGPQGHWHIVHGRGDTLASFEKSVEVASQLGLRAELQPVETDNHVLEQDPDFQHFASAGFDRLTQGKVGVDPLPEQSTAVPAPQSWIEKVDAHLSGKVDSIFAAAPKSPVGWLLEQPPPHTDVTAQFKSLYASAAKGVDVLPESAKQNKYILVPGLFTERYPGYMQDNLAALKAQGLDVEILDIDTDAAIATNAEAVKAAIEAAAADGQKAVLIGHSKGGDDATAALSLYPELEEHVAAMIPMQTPYGGTPIASDISACPELLPHVEGFIKRVFSGDPKALTDLSYEARQAFLEAHPYPSDVNTVCLASASDHPLSLTAAAATYVQQRYEEPSDGLVAKKDAIIPGSRAVILDGLDHSGPAMRQPAWLSNYQPGPLTVALVALALSPKS